MQIPPRGLLLSVAREHTLPKARRRACHVHLAMSVPRQRTSLTHVQLEPFRIAIRLLAWLAPAGVPARALTRPSKFAQLRSSIHLMEQQNARHVQQGKHAAAAIE